MADRSLSNKGRCGYTWTTYPERLQQAGMSWKVYQQKDNYGCNMLKNFKVFQQEPVGSPLYSRGMQLTPTGSSSMTPGTTSLPAVSWIIPTSFQCEHPDYMPADGAAFVARKIDAIAANPDVWAKTVFILNYDENDGLFDHVAPPVPRREHRTNLSEAFRSAAGSASRASSCRHGPREAGFAARDSTTLPSFSSWRHSPVSASPTSPTGAAALSAT